MWTMGLHKCKRKLRSLTNILTDGSLMSGSCRASKLCVLRCRWWRWFFLPLTTCTALWGASMTLLVTSFYKGVWHRAEMEEQMTKSPFLTAGYLREGPPRHYNCTCIPGLGWHAGALPVHLWKPTSILFLLIFLLLIHFKQHFFLKTDK